jgi:hypothetical protein
MYPIEQTIAKALLASRRGRLCQQGKQHSSKHNNSAEGKGFQRQYCNNMPQEYCCSSVTKDAADGLSEFRDTWTGL